MGYDWELIARLNVAARVPPPREPFDDALCAHRSGRASFEGTKLIRESARILAEPYDLRAATGDPVRGQVTGWRPVDRRPPYHVRRETRRTNACSGEFYVPTQTRVEGTLK